MCRKIVYLQTGFRKPIFLGMRACMEDIQGAIPRAWCRYCGGEIFTEEQVCRRCRQTERGDHYAFT